MIKESSLITDEDKDCFLHPFMVAIVGKAKKDEVHRRGYKTVQNHELNEVLKARFGFKVAAWTNCNMMAIVDKGKFNDTVGKWWNEISDISEAVKPKSDDDSGTGEGG